MLVYVLDINNRPLMPTKRFGKVRRMLRDGKAKKTSPDADVYLVDCHKNIYWYIVHLLTGDTFQGTGGNFRTIDISLHG